MAQSSVRGGVSFVALLLSLSGCSSEAGGHGESLGIERSALAIIGTELVGRPTDRSIMVHALFDGAVQAYVEYGTAPGVYTGSTAPTTFANGTLRTVVGGLSADTRHYYRLRYRESGSIADYATGTERTFHTQRRRGATFTFDVQTDSHQGFASFYSDALYAVTLDNIRIDQPDLLFDLGDTFSLDSASGGVTTETEATVRQKYLDQRSFFATAGHSTALFLVLGNHENEEGWNLNDFGTDLARSLPVLGANARKRYFVNPVPDAFYSGNRDASLTELDGDHLKENYYAFEWGDALFVAIDPFWYTTKKPYANGAAGGELNEPASEIGTRWDWTLGIEQYLWLKQTLEQSSARYKFVFAHHLVGGTEDYSRAGAKGAKYVEWGGYDTDGVTWDFDARRPATQGWTKPIHELLVDNGVSVFFHGHDHIFAKEELDGVVYQECPHAANEDYGAGFSNNPTNYPDAIRHNNSGYIRVTVSPSEATVEYVRSYLPEDEGENGRGFNRDVDYSYTVAPNGPCADDSDCDDGDACTTDACNAGGCSSLPVACDDGNACTTDACNPATGRCQTTAVSCDDQNPCTTDGCSAASGCTHAPIAACAVAAPRLEASTIAAGGAPVTVRLTHTYASPVIVTSVRYRNNTLPVVTRVSNVTEDSFALRLQNPSGQTPLAETVDYFVMEEGAWDFEGLRCEAQRVLSTVTDSDASWVGQARSYLRTYTTPVVLGQVMSENDAGFSVFWSRGSSATNPPSAASLFVGKAVGEDPDTTRADETLGLIVCDAGRGTLLGTGFEIRLGADTVAGAADAPPYVYAFSPAWSTAPAVAVVTQSAMDGANGSWAQLHGSSPLNASSLALSIDEDQLSDSERNHTNEQVSYAVFAQNLAYPDACPSDATKTAPGVCGCGVPEAATCGDACPNDPEKTAPGLCGCGVPDTDSDSDQTPNCNDACPADPAKVAAGTCGCGVAETDSDGDGIPDCIDPPDDNSPPVARNDSAAVQAGATVTIDVASNDSDVDSNLDPSSVAPISSPAGGAVSSGGDGTIDYAATPDYSGEDGFTYQVCDTLGACSTATVTVVVSPSPDPEPSPVEFVTTTAGGVATRVTLSRSHVDPIVVCSAQYSSNTVPIVVRVSLVAADGFDVRLQNPSGASLSTAPVSCLVVDSGAWTIDGVRLEAQKYTSSVTDFTTSWVGQRQMYLQSYASPVVLGQVMTENDPGWSVFWSQGNTRTNPPSPTSLVTGKMVGEDTDRTRVNETVGFIVIEAGHGVLRGVEYEAALGTDTILGVGDAPPYTYGFRTPFASPPRGAVVTMSAMDGPNGGWAQLHGSAPLTATEMRLSIDEDQVSDGERSHMNEQVAYVAFRTP
jgi:hypothetical protein